MKKIFPVLLFLLIAPKVYGQDIEVYVSDAGNFSSPPWQILKFDENGSNPEVFINTELAWPQDIVFLDDADIVLISNLSSNRITRHNAQTGAYIDNFTTTADGPTRMKIGPDNLLYVLQWRGNGKVKRYQLDGTYVDDFTETGVSQSIGLDWDSDGNLYVSSYNGDHVRKFDDGGKDLGLFISANLAGPTNIWFDDTGDLLVSDYDGTAVKRFGADGNFLGDFLTGLGKSEGVSIFSNGNILVGNGSNRSVKEFDSDGNYLRDFIGSGSGGLIAPNAVVIRNDTPVKPFELNTGLNDAWYDPATDGQGYFITVFPELQSVVLAWFTYDTELPAEDAIANLGDAGHRWLLAAGPIDGNKSEMQITIASGGLFDTATDIGREQDGSITLIFDSCNSGTVEYDIPSINQKGLVPIQRVANDNIALCKASIEP